MTLIDLTERLISALAAERSTYRAADAGDAADDACDTASAIVGDAIDALLQLDPDTIPDVAAYRVAMAACCRWFVIAEGDYSDATTWCCAQVRLLDLTLAGTPFDNDALWLWHVGGQMAQTRPAYQFPAARS